MRTRYVAPPNHHQTFSDYQKKLKNSIIEGRKSIERKELDLVLVELKEKKMSEKFAET